MHNVSENAFCFGLSDIEFSVVLPLVLTSIRSPVNRRGLGLSCILARSQKRLFSKSRRCCLLFLHSSSLVIFLFGRADGITIQMGWCEHKPPSLQLSTVLKQLGTAVASSKQYSSSVFVAEYFHLWINTRLLYYQAAWRKCETASNKNTTFNTDISKSLSF